MKNFKLLNGLSFLLALVLFNCNTPSNLLQDGDYDEAVYKAIMNLQKGKKKKEKDIIVVEEAYRKITAKDMAAIESLQATGDPASWVKINKLHNDIKERQELIAPYLPLIATKTYYKADFMFVNINPLELDSRKKAAQYYYVAGLDRMIDARRGNKSAARNAYRKFSRVQTYFNTFEDNNALMNEAHEIGIDKVLFDLQDNTYGYTPYFAREELSFFDERSLNDTWTKYYTVHNAPEDIDFRVEVDIAEIDLSPERVQYDEYPVTKKLFKTIKVPANQGDDRPGGGRPGRDRPRGDRPGATGSNTPTIQIGTTVLNAGTVKIDASNTDRPGGTNTDRPNNNKPNKADLVTKKVPYWVKALVLDTRVSKSAYMSAKVRFIDANNGRVLSSERIAVEENFLNITTTFRGDKRALPNDVRCRLTNRLMEVPRDSEMILNAAVLLKDKIGHFVRTEDSIVML